MSAVVKGQVEKPVQADEHEAMGIDKSVNIVEATLLLILSVLLALGALAVLIPQWAPKF